MILNGGVGGSGGVTPSGTFNITSNGTYDVYSYASASVTVSGGEGYTLEDIAEKNISGEITCNASAVGSFAFYGYSQLLSVNFPYATTLNLQAFAQCSNLATASFPVATIMSASAFYACSSLSNIYFPAMEDIKGNAFVNCIALSVASFPNVTSIGTYAFQSCTHLLSLYLNNISAVPTLARYAFQSTPIDGYTASTGGVYGSVYVPSSLYSSFLTATRWSDISARIVSV